MSTNFLFVQTHLHPRDSEWHKELDGKVDNLDTTEDGEAREEPHGASNEAKLGLQGHLDVSLYLVKRRCVKVDLDQLQTPIMDGGCWKYN